MRNQEEKQNWQDQDEEKHRNWIDKVHIMEPLKKRNKQKKDKLDM